jgi:hypothetical protein
VRGQIRTEEGSVLVLLAVWLPVLILFASFVIDVGNWYTHKRHLQTQADAAAFAGGDGFSFPCNNTPIEDQARTYAGPSSSTPAALYNSQLGGTPASRLHVLLNAPQFYNQDTSQPQTGFGSLGTACGAGFLDVKITESNLPWFFVGGRFVPAINAHARVSLQQQVARSGTIPVAIPDPGAVTAGAVDFINEDTGAVLGSSNLTSAGSGAFNNSATPVTVDMAGVSHLGVVAKLSGATPPPSTLSCGQTLVVCFDLSSVNGSGVPSRGFMFVHGYPATGYTTGVAGEPTVKNVQHFVGGTSPCSDAYFFALATGTCTLGVTADVTFADAAGNKRSVTATISDLNTPPDYTNTNDLKNTTGTTWLTDGTGQAKYFSIPAQAGPLNVTLTWTKKEGSYNGTTCTNSNPCTGNWNGYVFQRAFSGSDPTSGPIGSAVLNEGTASTFTPSSHSYLNSGAGSTTHSLWVNLQMQPALGYATGVNSPVVYLRVTGSQNQTIDCDPNYSNLRDELDFGCRPTYKINTTFTCPSYSALWNTPQPWACVKTQTGGATGQVTQGLEARMTRLTGTTCPANHWSSFPNLSPTDPRLVPVIITPFGTFGASGNDIVPVTGFTELYITGWPKQGSGKSQPDCPGDDAPPGGGYIVGHFVRYVDTINTGGGGPSCNQNVFGNCVVVLTQ